MSRLSARGTWDVELLQAVLSNDTGIIQLLIENGADVNQKVVFGNIPIYDHILRTDPDTYGELMSGKITDRTEEFYRKMREQASSSLLEIAIKSNKMEAAEILIRAGAKVDFQDWDGSTFVHHAISSGNIHLLNLLVEKKADVNVQNHEGDVPLHMAVSAGSVEMVRILIKGKADLDTQDKYGVSCLYKGVQNNNIEIVKLLIEKGANLNTQLKNYGFTALSRAVSDNNIEIVKLLVEKGASLDIQSNGYTPLHISMRDKNTEMVKLLLESKADARIETKHGNVHKYLYSAVSTHDIETVRLLIKGKADLDTQDEYYGYTSLHRAMYDKNTEMVKLLVKGGANLDSQDNNGYAPLHIAVLNKDIETVQLLLRYHANLNVQNNRGNTPLHMAILDGRKKVAILLIKYGSDLNVQNFDGKTAWDLARHENYVEIIEYMNKIPNLLHSNTMLDDQLGKTETTTENVIPDQNQQQSGASNLLHSKAISLGNADINIKHNLAGNKLEQIATSIIGAIHDYKSAFGSTPNNREINVYVFDNQKDFRAYLKHFREQEPSTSIVGLTYKTAKGADVYVFLDSKGNISQNTLKHEIGHAMQFTTSGALSHVIPTAMHEGIANYTAGLKDGTHINDHVDIKALSSIRKGNLKPDEILKNNYRGTYYYSEAEQVIKFLKDKHPDLLNKLQNHLSISQDEGAAKQLMKNFMDTLKKYRPEFRKWVEEQQSSENEVQQTKSIEFVDDTQSNTLPYGGREKVEGQKPMISQEQPDMVPNEEERAIDFQAKKQVSTEHNGSIWEQVTHTISKMASSIYEYASIIFSKVSSWFASLNIFSWFQGEQEAKDEDIQPVEQTAEQTLPSTPLSRPIGACEYPNPVSEDDLSPVQDHNSDPASF